MKPNYYPFEAPATCFLVPETLAATECSEVVDAVTRQGGFEPTAVDYPPSYRDNDRAVLESAELAARLFARLRDALPAELVDGDGGRHRLEGLNERFRLCRYRDGQSFRIHRDGAHAPTDRVRSRLTVQIYLDDGFVGGRTRFYRTRAGGEIGAVVPRVGTAIVFDHELWHDGEPVTSGTKHVMRTDVLYERVEAPAVAELPGVLQGHDGYVFAVHALANGAIASGSRDRTIRIWERDATGRHRCTRAMRGHDASVLAIAALRDGAIVSGSRDRTVRAWSERGDGRVLATLGGAVLSLAVLDAETVACGSADGRIAIVSRDGERGADLVGHVGWVWALATLPDGHLVSGGDDGTVRLWDAARGECVAAAAAGRGPVHALAVLSSGAVAAGFADGHVVVYEVRGALDLAPVRVHRAHDGEVYALRALPNDRFASGGEDCAVRIHDARGDATEVLRCGGFVRAIDLLDDGLAVGSYDGAVRLRFFPEIDASTSAPRMLLPRGPAPG